jgi:hypothetical protein
MYVYLSNFTQFHYFQYDKYQLLYIQKIPPDDEK